MSIEKVTQIHISDTLKFIIERFASNRCVLKTYRNYFRTGSSENGGGYIIERCGCSFSASNRFLVVHKMRLTLVEQTHPALPFESSWRLSSVQHLQIFLERRTVAQLYFRKILHNQNLSLCYLLKAGASDVALKQASQL